MDWLKCAGTGAGPRIRTGTNDSDNTPRIRLIVRTVRDEGIVQPFSKEREKLSRRLHQK